MDEEDQPIPVFHNLVELIEKLREVFSSDKVNVDYVKALLASYKSNPADWKQYAKFDQHRYTRNLIDTGNGKYNLLALCWGEGHGSSVHDHSDSHCFVKVLDGQLKETLFAWPERDSIDENGTSESTRITGDDTQRLMEIGSNVYSRDGVAYINDSMGLHRMENPSHSDPTVTMHLYSPPFEFCRTFDERTGCTRKVHMTFWSKFGERTPISETLNECSTVAPRK